MMPGTLRSRLKILERELVTVEEQIQRRLLTRLCYNLFSVSDAVLVAYLGAIVKGTEPASWAADELEAAIPVDAPKHFIRRAQAMAYGNANQVSDTEIADKLTKLMEGAGCCGVDDLAAYAEKMKIDTRW